ncbi:replication-relaxation family protein [Stratiformator vulcanicus]|uniref:Replication-relaxation n=1 Tax=Stratiformator vulcanicus TaxID=2527980 RepID=A0A517R3H8_9PLAN|nr:hypothetical protein [Stratiformator vulcanicus]QDT38383.1 hypothetical protein Pan189_27760 [Stratiformator vulcanicus]
MPKKFRTKIGPRDIEILEAIDRCPLTAAQLKWLSNTFEMPFRDEHNLRRRLRLLGASGLIRCWPYALVGDGRAPRYWKLTRDGYRLLYGEDAPLPRRRHFEEIGHGRHHHTHALTQLVVRLITAGQDHGIRMTHFARENSVRLETGSFTVYPDCGFRLETREGKSYCFHVELDNGSERVRTRQDVESIERKLRAYDAHQSQFSADDPDRYMVLFVTTRSEARLDHVFALANDVMRNRQRTVFLGCGLETLMRHDPYREAIFRDHRGLKRTILPLNQVASEKPTERMTAPASA